MTFSVTMEIRASAQRVWTIMYDVERWPEWTPTVRSVKRLDRGPLDLGSRVLIRQPRLPPAYWKISAIESGRGFTWTTRGPGVTAIARHWVDAIEGGSRATLSVEFRGIFGPLVGALTRALNERYLELEAAGLKRRSEESQPV